MIKFENTDVHGLARAIYSARNAMNSWHLSDSNLEKDIIGENDMKLAKNLVKAGTDHSKFMRMITVTVDITAPRYWWTEADAYKVGIVRNSCSTMHKIHEKEFTLDDFSHEHLYTEECGVPDHEEQISLEVLKNVIRALNYAREDYLEFKHKGSWWQMIQLLPQSYNQRATMQLNYQVLRNIYFSRKGHKLNEWHDFCDWIKTLPYSELITEPSAIVPEWNKIEPDEEGVYTGNLPYVGEEVLFCAKNGEIFIDELCCDGFDDDGNRMAYIGNGYDLGDIAAWMPLPKPYKE